MNGYGPSLSGTVMTKRRAPLSEVTHQMSEHPEPNDKQPVDSLHERRSTGRGKNRTPAAGNEELSVEFILNPQGPCEIRVRVLGASSISGKEEEGIVVRTAEEATYFMGAITKAADIGRQTGRNSRNVKPRNTGRDDRIVWLRDVKKLDWNMILKIIIEEFPDVLEAKKSGTRPNMVRVTRLIQTAYGRRKKKHD